MRTIHAGQSNGSPGGAAPPDELVEEVLDALASVRAVGFRSLRHVDRDAVSIGHLHVLGRLRTAGPLPVSRVARALGVSAASATGMVGRMEERGLVERVRDERDRRVVLVRLAPGGQALLDEIGQRNRAAFGRILGRLEADELTQLRNGLRALHRATKDAAAAEDDAPSARDAANGAAGIAARPDRGNRGPEGDDDAAEDPA